MFPFSLEDELDAVEKEWNRLPKREELEQHIREIERQVEELNDEISMVGLPTGYWLVADAVYFSSAPKTHSATKRSWIGRTIRSLP